METEFNDNGYCDCKSCMGGGYIFTYYVDAGRMLETNIEYIKDEIKKGFPEDSILTCGGYGYNYTCKFIKHGKFTINSAKKYDRPHPTVYGRVYTFPTDENDFAIFLNCESAYDHEINECNVCNGTGLVDWILHARGF